MDQLTYLTDPDEAVRTVARMTAEPWLAADTETMARPQFAHIDGAALSPVTGTVRLVQLCDGRNTVLIDLDQVPASVLKPLERARLVFHNATFDLQHLAALGIHIADPACSMLACAMLFGEPTMSLARAAKRVLNKDLNKDEQTSDWAAAALSSEQLQYAAGDVEVLHQLYTVLLQRLQDQGRMQGYRLVRQCLPAVAAAQRHGLLLDTNAHDTLVGQWTHERDDAEQTLRGLIGDLNLRSPKQLTGWLMENLDPAVLQRWPRSEKKGHLATKRDTLEQFATVPLVRPLLTHRNADTRLKTWGHAYQRHLRPDGRLHPGFLLLGAGHTGRMSCRQPNTQNLPRDPALRACFIAPEGYRILAADFSQIELRIPALLSGDPVLRDAYTRGRDLHRLIVSATTGVPEHQVTDAERKKGKAINFLFLYGGGVDTYRTRAFVSYGLDISEDEAAYHRDVFDQTYAALRWWQSEEYAEHQRVGGVKTVGGRWLPFPDPNDCYTNSRNYPIQGSAADLQYLAIQRVHNAIQGMDAHLINFVHDELVLEVRADQVEKVAALVQDQMTNAFLDLFKSFDPAPLAKGLVEIGVGQSYAEAK